MKVENKRNFYGNLASIVGVFANFILAFFKILFGFLSGTISVVADGFNNLTDSGSSIISLVSFKLSSKPADKEHPFGHERVEYILSMVVGFVILFIAFELFMESITKIFNPTTFYFSIYLIIVLIVSIIIKLFLFVFNRIIAKKINSSILHATSIDCLTDCISTLTVLVTTLLNYYLGINLDSYAGVFVACFITYSGISVLKSTASMLIGKAPGKEVIEDIKNRILSKELVYGIHDLNVYSYGPNKCYASVHIEIDSEIDVLIAHEIIDEIELDFLQNTNIILTGHLDPIVTNDEKVNKMRFEVSKLLHNIDSSLSMHDFRMVEGVNNTNLIFDIAVPFDFRLKDEMILDILNNEIATFDGNYKLVVRIEKQTL